LPRILRRRFKAEMREHPLGVLARRRRERRAAMIGWAFQSSGILRLTGYVRRVGRWTPVYMALIDPFRRLLVYPSLLRSVRATWNRIFVTA
jgi:hypothetical protein